MSVTVWLTTSNIIVGQAKILEDNFQIYFVHFDINNYYIIFLLLCKLEYYDIIMVVFNQYFI